ncbi:hypothetical protein ADJ70_13690 [Olsenella sp. oral taxon 807]|uniref:hypothetical protein n=1 Tax=Olsenella sp. oral taxon 807 TaxID=712411 RepID=UPI000679EBCF|nr:hypothetical protein [Olsenella sp. oral taxon 807]AKT49746.1 hypothetical protein ADJ70_13690 [Olsenella sp. oral taxon 807]
MRNTGPGGKGTDAGGGAGPSRWLPLAAVALCLAVAVGYCVAKRGFFVDEVWSYGYANSHYAPFLSDVAGGDLAGATLTRRDLLDYVSVGEGERMDVGSVLHNQEGDLHPPLFGLALNAASSLAPGAWSKWAGLGLNLACHAVALVALWALLRELGCSRAACACGVALWGLSRAGLSDVLYIRMYEMLTALTVLLALELAALMREGASGGARRLLPAAVGATVFLGLMTQYYFAIYAFLACLAAGTHLLRRRRLGEAGALAACALAGVGLFLLAWPAALAHLGAHNSSSGVSGGDALTRFVDLAAWPEKFSQFGEYIIRDMSIAIAWLLSAWIAVHLGRRKTQVPTTERDGTSSIIVAILVPVPIVIILIIIIAPYLSPRYLYSSLPLVAAGTALSLDTWFRQIPESQRRRKVIFVTGTTMAVLLLLCVVMKPMYLGDYEYAQRKTVAPYAAGPCVYLIKRGYTDAGLANLSITADMLQLMEFEDVHVETDPASAGIAAYLASKGDPDEVVLYVDVSGTTSTRAGEGTASTRAGEGTAREVAGRLGYSRCTYVKGFSGADNGYNSSETYLLGR